MRNLALAVLLATVLAAVATVPAAAGSSSGTCWVNPDPVSVGAEFTVHGSGLGPSADYWAWITQPGNDAPGNHPMFGTATDAAGNFVLALDAEVAAYGHALEPGSMHVKLDAASWEGNQLPTARCDFEVTG